MDGDVAAGSTRDSAFGDVDGVLERERFDLEKRFDHAAAAMLSTAVYAENAWMIASMSEPVEKMPEWRILNDLDKNFSGVQRAVEIRSLYAPLAGVELEKGQGSAIGDGMYYRGGLFYNGEQACACLLEREGFVGERVIELSFRGTEQNTTGRWLKNKVNMASKYLFGAYPDMAEHYELFRPLIDELVRIANQRTMDGERVRVVASGHSLGGAMVQMFMDQDAARIGVVPVEGVSFGSPGIGRTRNDVLFYAHNVSKLTLGAAARLFDSQGGESKILPFFGKLVLASINGIKATMGMRSYAELENAKFKELSDLTRMEMELKGERRDGLTLHSGRLHQFADMADMVPQAGAFAGLSQTGDVLSGLQTGGLVSSVPAVRPAASLERHSMDKYEKTRLDVLHVAVMKMQIEGARAGGGLSEPTILTMYLAAKAKAKDMANQLLKEYFENPEVVAKRIMAKAPEELRRGISTVDSSVPSSQVDRNNLVKSLDEQKGVLAGKIRSRKLGVENDAPRVKNRLNLS